MNNYIYVIILTFILTSTNFFGDYNKNLAADSVENNIGNKQNSKWLPETKVIQDKNSVLNETSNQVVDDETEKTHREVSKESDEYLAYFVGKSFDPSYHPPTAASGSVFETIVIDTIEDRKASGHISSQVAFIGSYGAFNNIPINDDNSIIVINTWNGKDPQTEELFPEAYTETKITFDRIVNGNPIIKTIDLGPVDGSEKILEEYYFNSEPGTIHEWFSNSYMYYDLSMSEEEMVDWLTKNINTPWK